MSHWLIRYTAPTGRNNLVLEMPYITAKDIADRLCNATLLPVQDAACAQSLAAALDRIFASVRLAC